MRLFPAHIRDAKQMARGLFESFTYLGLPRDWNDQGSAPPSLQQAQELMATAMGYAGWRELAMLVQQPHSPVYLDQLEQHHASEAIRSLEDRLAKQVGLDFVHSSIRNAVAISGVGFSPKARRAMAEQSTPWGQIDIEHEPIADGIRSISTSSHGGWLLSEERQARMPAHLRNADAAYEEDGEYHLVVLAFPEEEVSFGVSVRDALNYLSIVDSSQAQKEHEDAMRKLWNSGADLQTIDFPSFVEPPLSELESRVLVYLANCVRTNRIPIRFPGEAESCVKNLMYHARGIYQFNRFDDWVKLLSIIPTIDGSWATRPGPWFDHWEYRAREEQMFEARETGEREMFAQTEQ